MHSVVSVQQRHLTNETAEAMVKALSKKELIVAWLITMGKRTPEIVQKMNISKRTLDVHLRSIRIKLGGLPTYGIPMVVIRARGFDIPKDLGQI